MIFNKKSKYYKISLIILIIISSILLIYGIYIYNIAFKPNVKIHNSTEYFLKIPTNSSFNDVIKIIENDSVLKNINTFIKLSKKKNYPKHVYPGRYLIKNKMGNNKIINLLRSGKQKPFNVIFNNIRTKERLAQVISNQIEADSSSLVNLLNDEEFLSKYNLNQETAISIFIPNTYQFYWNTNAEAFFNRMFREFDVFWNEERIQKSEEIGLSKIEVITLASIIDEEAVKKEELRRIAGVYMNRLQQRMRLQADPTIKFILGDFTVRRILYDDLEIDSPYNTYKYWGLPPGPIRIPSIAAINAVLNYEKNEYLYFCAKEDFSGFHNFAKTLDEHNRNKRLYLRALDKNEIYR
ncbi:MAG: endolytic transglycosylase MltG [Bacteroidales bacterium]|nr:endolytic transglycosylase MltG [Bacteroidales bacterium]